MLDMVIEKGLVVLPGGTRRVSVGVLDGKIVEVAAPGRELRGKTVIDATGRVVLPGLVDGHVHAGHGTPDRESFACASKAAAAGGITTIVEMPLSEPSTVTVRALEDKKASASEQCVVDFALYSGVLPGHFDDIEPTFRAGAQAFKAFMCRCSNYPMTDDGTLLRGMRKVGELGGVVCVHAENDTLIQELVDRFRAEGRKDARAFIDSHPEYSELEAVHRLLFLAEQAPECAVHVCHMSVASGAKLIREARGRGVANVTCETCPQYLGLTEDDLVRVGAFAKCDPPVRSRETVDAMWGYVLDGTVDIVATDHSPHPAARKTGRSDDFWTVAEGCTGLQTMLPVLLTQGRPRGLSWERLAELCASRPAEIFGVADRKGRIEPGLDADFAIVDPDVSWTLRESDLFYLNPASPHTGETFTGRVSETILRGQVVCRDGAILAPEGTGRFLPMRRR